jgi:hypothetical protein
MQDQPELLQRLRGELLTPLPGSYVQDEMCLLCRRSASMRPTSSAWTTAYSDRPGQVRCSLTGSAWRTGRNGSARLVDPTGWRAARRRRPAAGNPILIPESHQSFLTYPDVVAEVVINA